MRKLGTSVKVMHPLTCGKSGHNHRNLVGFEDNGIVKLKCLDCAYVQDDVPEIIYEAMKVSSDISHPAQ